MRTSFENERKTGYCSQAENGDGSKGSQRTANDNGRFGKGKHFRPDPEFRRGAGLNLTLDDVVLDALANQLEIVQGLLRGRAIRYHSDHRSAFGADSHFVLASHPRLLHPLSCELTGHACHRHVGHYVKRSGEFGIRIISDRRAAAGNLYRWVRCDDKKRSRGSIFRGDADGDPQCRTQRQKQTWPDDPPPANEDAPGFPAGKRRSYFTGRRIWPDYARASSAYCVIRSAAKRLMGGTTPSGSEAAR